MLSLWSRPPRPGSTLPVRTTMSRFRKKANGFLSPLSFPRPSMDYQRRSNPSLLRSLFPPPAEKDWRGHTPLPLPPSHFNFFSLTLFYHISAVQGRRAAVSPQLLIRIQLMPYLDLSVRPFEWFPLILFPPKFLTLRGSVRLL